MNIDILDDSENSDNDVFIDTPKEDDIIISPTISDNDLKKINNDYINDLIEFKNLENPNNKKLTKRGYVLYKDELSNKFIKKLKQRLTACPIVFNIYSNAKPDKYQIYRENKKKIYIPRFFGINIFGLPKNIIFNDDVKLNMIFTKELRQHQVEIVNIMLNGIKKKGGGILSACCGLGKTIMAIYIACTLNIKTLIIVHKSFLLNQWKERILEFTNCDVGYIRQKKVDTSNSFTIAMLQSLSKREYPPDTFKDYQLVIVDEVHHISSKVFSKTLPKIASKYMMGLSATPKRKDGLTKVFKWYIGDILYKSKNAITDTVYVQPYHFHDENMTTEYINTYSSKSYRNSRKMNKDNSLLMTKTNFIISLLPDLIKQKRKILILSHYRDHVILLNSIIKESKIAPCGLYIGEMKQCELDDSMEKDILLATYDMVKEAFDNKKLNTLIMATSITDLEQTIGRITRQQHKIKPLVIDIIDNNLYYHFEKREKIYKKLKFIMQ
jgi:superfamily II DNA or RNA helicase